MLWGPPLQLAAALVASAPVGRGWHALSGGVVLVDARPRIDAVLPAPTASVRVAWAAARWAEIGLRYSTVALLSHEVGLFARARVAGGRTWALGATLEGAGCVVPWVPGEDMVFLDLAVRASLSFGAMLSERVALTLEANVAERFLESTFSQFGRFQDTVPVLRTVGGSLGLTWGTTESRRYTVRARVDADPMGVMPGSVGGVFIGLSAEVTWLR